MFLMRRCRNVDLKSKSFLQSTAIDIQFPKKNGAYFNYPIKYTGHPSKMVKSADDTIYTIYQSLFTQSADPNPFRGTHCCYPLETKVLIQENLFLKTTSQS